MNVLIGVIAILAFLLEVAGEKGENPRSCSCVFKDCYTATRDPVDFKTSSDMCKEIGGHLMTVRSTVSSDVIYDLLSNLFEDFWIGLKLPAGRCSNTSPGLLRGYEWTTGDNSTDFTNWKSNATVCSPMCVSVSSDQKWSERPCQDKVAGYLCENNYESTCKPLKAGANESVSYSTPFGFKGEGLLALPPGSVATHSPSGIKKICAPDTDAWLGAPWSCDTENGGCEHLCHVRNGVAECICKPGEGPRGVVACRCADGFKMVGGKCTDDNECMLAPCEHVCHNTDGSYMCSCYEGYKQSSEDPRRCKRHCPSEECPADCDRNVDTSCTCPEGYILDTRTNGSFCVDVDECRVGAKECDQHCENTFGSFRCYCDSGFDLKTRSTCVRRDSVFTTPVSNEFLISSSNDIIKSACVATVGVVTVIVLCLQSRCL